MKHKHLAVLLMPVLFTACAQKATTPSAWFDEATRVLQKHYYGYQLEHLKPLIQSHDQHLEKLCAATCSQRQAETALQNLLRDLGDTHTHYRTPEETQEDRLFSSGGTSAVRSLGVRLGYLANHQLQVVLMVQKGSPAERMGLKRGDGIRSINQHTFATESLSLFQKTVQSGNPFTLEILNAGNQLRNLKGQGENLPGVFRPELITEGVPRGTGVLRIPDMNVWESVSRQVHSLVRTAQQKQLNTLILDLRNNPGGFVWEMMSIASIFLDRVELVNAYPRSKEHVVAEQGKVKNTLFYLPFVYRGPEPARWTGKVVVLVNEKTASAAEYLAYILQQHHRAVVVGEPTRGLLNTTTQDHDLSNGGSLSITVTRTLNEKGERYPLRVTPDIERKDDLERLVFEGRDLMLGEALQVSLVAQPQVR